MAAILILRLANSSSRFLRRNQALIATTKAEPTIQLDVTVWVNFDMATGENSTAQKSAISLRTVSGLKCMPSGNCIQAFATKIHKAERVAPITVSQVAARWNFLLTLFQPKNITAIKVDSIKKAIMPSMASGAPKISPTNQL